MPLNKETKPNQTKPTTVTITLSGLKDLDPDCVLRYCSFVWVDLIFGW